MYEYEQIAIEGKETLTILKWKTNEKSHNEENVKESEEPEQKERERKHKLDKQKI